MFVTASNKFSPSFSVLINYSLDSPTCLWNSLLNYKVIETPLCIPGSFACSEMIIRLRFRPQHHQLNALADSSDFPINFWCHRQHIRAIQRKTSRISALGKVLFKCNSMEPLDALSLLLRSKSIYLRTRKLIYRVGGECGEAPSTWAQSTRRWFCCSFCRLIYRSTAPTNHFQVCIENCVARKYLSSVNKKSL